VFRLSYSALLLAALDGGHRFAEKNPENSFLVPFLAAEFPGAQFVHIVRDGRDAAVSHAEKPWLAAASASSGQRGTEGRLRGPGPAGEWTPQRENSRTCRHRAVGLVLASVRQGSPERCGQAGAGPGGGPLRGHGAATRRPPPTAWPGSAHLGAGGARAAMAQARPFGRPLARPR
jgi:hypothetical protein